MAQLRGRICHHHGRNNSHEEEQGNRKPLCFCPSKPLMTQVSDITGHCSAEKATISKNTDGSGSSHSLSAAQAPCPFSLHCPRPWELSTREASWDGHWLHAAGTALVGAMGGRQGSQVPMSTVKYLSHAEAHFSTRNRMGFSSLKPAPRSQVCMQGSSVLSLCHL